MSFTNDFFNSIRFNLAQNYNEIARRESMKE